MSTLVIMWHFIWEFFVLKLTGMWQLIIAGVSFVFFFLHINAWKWSVWLLLSVVIAGCKALFGLYQSIRIVCTLSLLVLLKFYLKLYKKLRSLTHIFDTSGKYFWRKKLAEANTYHEWFKCAQEVDDAEGNHDWVDSDENLLNNTKLTLTTKQLASYREENDHKKIIYELPGLVKRNHLGIDDYEVHARCLTGTKKSIENFRAEILACFEYVKNLDESVFSKEDKINFFQKLSRNLGHTALCLSGGGSLSMYHMGVLRALIESGNYANIRVISGASGGSISTGMCAIHKEEDLLKYVLVDNVSTDFLGTGEMQRNKIEWFPPLWKQAINFIKTGFLVNNKEFMRTCKFYYGDVTFEEAYNKTRKHVCISVTRQGAGSGGPSKLLLNHISTPHVLIRSAVAASCALPGIMEPNDLMMKSSEGEIIPFHVDGEGVQFLDGSVQADVPFRRMSALFSVSNFIVSQVNVHVLPFIEHKIPGALPSGSNLLRDMLASLDLDLRHRSVILSKMGIMPKLYGHDISAVFKQVYHGNVTIVPQMKVEEALGVKAIMNPSKEDMKAYISGGRKASWPHLRRVRHLLCLEGSLWTILEDLVETSDQAVGSTRDSDDNVIVNPSSDIPPLQTEKSVSNLVMYSNGNNLNSLSSRLRNDHRGSKFNTAEKAATSVSGNGMEADVEVLVERIRALEDENSRLKRKLNISEDDSNDMDMEDESSAQRKRRLSSCLVPM